MLVRITLVGALAATALIFASGVQAAGTPGDANDRQGAAAVEQFVVGGDAHERAISPSRAVSAGRDAHERTAPTPTTTIVAGPGGFDWGDAAIGALGGMGLALLLGGLVFLALGQRTRTLAVR